MYTIARSNCCLIPTLIPHSLIFFFFFNDTATTEIYTLSLHDALPIYPTAVATTTTTAPPAPEETFEVFGSKDRKSTRLNSSHLVISYAVFCLKKKTEAR